jgi:hypothetical protein
LQCVCTQEYSWKVFFFLVILTIIIVSTKHPDIADMRSFLLLSASVDSISSMPSPVYQCKKALLWNIAVNGSLTWLNRFCCNTMLWGLWWSYSFTPSLPPGFSWVAIWETTAAPGRKWTYKHREWWIDGHAWIAVQQCVHKSTWIASCLVSNEFWQQFQAFALDITDWNLKLLGNPLHKERWVSVLHIEHLFFNFIGTHVSHRTWQTLSGSDHDKDMQHTSCSWCPISVESALALIMLGIAGILWCQCCEPNHEDMESLERDQVDCKLAGGQSSLAQGNGDSKSHHS